LAPTIEEQRAIRKTPIWLALEGINRSKMPIANSHGRQLENNSASISAAGGGRAVEVPMAQNHSSSRTRTSVRTTRESVNDSEYPSSIWFLMDFVNCS